MRAWGDLGRSSNNQQLSHADKNNDQEGITKLVFWLETLEWLLYLVSRISMQCSYIANFIVAMELHYLLYHSLIMHSPSKEGANKICSNFEDTLSWLWQSSATVRQPLWKSTPRTVYVHRDQIAPIIKHSIGTGNAHVVTQQQPQSTRRNLIIPSPNTTHSTLP